MGKYWDEAHECMDRESMRALQTERLIKAVKYVWERVPQYRNKMDEAGLKPEDIRSLDDLKLLPFTYKYDLRDTYPFGMFAVGQEDVVRIHASSGTTGKPTVVGYTRNDIEMWSNLMARCMTSAGMDKSSVLQVAYGYGLFTGGLGAHYGGECLGASVVPASSGNTKKQLMLMKDFGVTHLACTPSYALYIAEVMDQLGYDRNDFKLKAGIFGAEPWTEALRHDIETKLGIDALDIYGMSELMGPGVSCECLCKQGMHIHEDHFIPEIIDPETGEVLPEGSVGELVISAVTKEALPIIRYRTRDITSLNYEKCECGRTLVRMNRIIGRSDDMLIIRGVNVFPSQIESVLLDFPEVAPYYMLVVTREGVLDALEVRVELSEKLFSDEVKKLEDLNKRIVRELQTVLGVAVKVTLVSPKSIERSEGKAKRILDQRNI